MDIFLNEQPKLKAYSTNDELDLNKFEIQDKIFQIDQWKYYKIIQNFTKKEYLAISSSRSFKKFTRGNVIDFFRGISTNSKINYPTVLNYVGYSLTNFKNKSKPVIIAEYTSKNTLSCVLRQLNKNPKIFGWTDTIKLINIYGIASCMSYLHSNNILYRNLTPDSIFLDENFHPKITHFEYSKELPKNGFINDYEIKGNIKYQAPEVLTHLLYSKSSDVYSFSLIMYLILTNNEPYSKLKWKTDIIRNISIKNERPTFDVHVEKCYKDLIERCWSPDLNERPTFDQILNELKTNKELITEKVDKAEYEKYIRSIEESPKSFNLVDKKRNIDTILKDINLEFNSIRYKKLDPYSKTEFDLSKYNFVIFCESNNEYIQMTDAIDGLSTESYRKEINFFFRNEIVNFYQKLNVLSQISHPAILKFFGYSPINANNEQKPVIITEYLHKSLKIHKNTSFTEKLSFIYGIASAMDYLHSHGIIHRDLKTSNIYIDTCNNIKIGGFDLAIELKDKNSIKCDKIKGSPAYLAPEVYTNKEYSRKSDVYSFAMILYEIMTGKKPFEENMSPKEIYETIIENKIRPTFAEPINTTYRELIERCWQEDPKERPTFSEIIQELKTNRGFINEEINEDYFLKYIKFIEESPITSFNPTERISIFDEIIETKLHTYKEIEPCSGLSSIYDTETNDILFDHYNYINMNDFEFKYEEPINHYFYEYWIVINNETNEEFMVKTPNKDIENFSKNEIINFANELSIISQINHPSIIKFIGFNSQQNECNVFLELINGESLDNLIKKNLNLDDTKKLIIIFGIASGMSYLHSHNILHRDLKTSNILINESMHPKIFGFNISIEIQKNLIEKCDKIKGSPAYLAPEIYTNKEYSRKSDVYSFAMILYEIMTGKKPFERNMSPKEIYETIIENKTRPTFAEPINTTYRDLIERCWQEDPKERPTFSEILQELKTNRGFIKETINEEEYKKYIEFIEENQEISFCPERKISNFDLVIKNRLDDFHENENIINFRDIYETEYDDVLFNYDYVNLNDFEKIEVINVDVDFKKYKVKDKKTEKTYIAYRFNDSFDDVGINPIYKNSNFVFINSMIGLNYPSILKFIGYSPFDFKNRPRPVFIIESANNGSLKYFFNDKNIDGENEEEEDFNKSLTLLNDTKRLINIYGIASAMSYSHSLNRIHGDLHLECIKLDDFLYPKVIASDEILDEPPTVYDDVYDFGLIVYTLIKNKMPYEYFPPPEIDDSFSPCYKNLLEKCFNENEEERPTFDEIVFHLKNNPEFITDSVDKEEFQDYLKYLEKYQTDQTFLNDFVSSSNFTFRKVHLDINKIKKSERIRFTIDMGSIDISNYKKIENIGDGSFGVVYTVFDKKMGKVYAAKKSKYSIDKCPDNIIINITREINIISLLNHPSILQFIGYYPMNFDKTKYKPMIITEYISNGSLENILKKERKGLAPKSWDDTKKLINIYGIASGMKYVHSLNILHRDLKPDNILLDDSLYPKICDFGLSKNINDNDINYINPKEKKKYKRKRSQLKGTPAYWSPEIVKDCYYSKKSDVYAFGMIVYQIVTNETLFENIGYYDLLIRIVEGDLPQFKYQIPYCYKNLILKCWSQNPSKRYSFSKIVDILENDPSFISPNIDDVEYRNYINLTKEKPTLSVHSIKKNEQYQNISSQKEKEENKEESLFLNLSKFDIDSVINKRKSFKLYKIKDKETQLFYQCQISMNKINDSVSNEDYQKLLKTITNIKEIKHQSLLKFIGYSPIDFKKQRKPVIVTELPSNGSLLDILEITRKDNKIEEWNDTKKLMNIYGIAEALSYLHSNDIIHRSLDSSSIYLDDVLLPKIGDFGLSTLFDDSIKITHQSLAQTKMDFIYAAPEVLSKNVYSKSSDVYAFGMIVYEIVTNEIPFDEIENDQQIVNLIVNDQYRPKIKENVPLCYRKLIEKCWSQNPEERPKFDEIVHQLIVDTEFITNQIKIEDYYKYINFIKGQKVKDDID